MADFRGEMLSRAAVVWRRRWVAVAMAWAVCAAGWGFVLTIPDEYTSQARIYVDTDTLLGPLLHNLAVANDLAHQVQIMERTMLTRPNLQQVIAATDLGLHAKTAVDEQNLFDRLQRSTHIEAQAVNLFIISHVDATPALARDVVQALITILTENNLGQNRVDMEKARSFIDKQIADYESTLRSVERRMAEFKATHLDELSSGGDFTARRETASQALETARRELADAQAKRDSLREQLQAIPPFLELQSSPQVIVNGQIDPTQARIAELRKTLADLRLRYTDRHPDVIATKRSLDELLAQTAASEKSAPHNPAVTKGQIANPVYEQAQVRMLDAEGAVNMASHHVEQAEEDMKKILALAGSAPKVENAYNDLAREYGVEKKQYEELLQRRESARLSEAVQNSATKVQFRIIEPPNLPVKPSGPRRSLFLSVVLVVGALSGIGFAFILDQIHNPVNSMESLAERFGIPVLGEISLVQAVGHQFKRRRQAIAFGLAVTALLAAYAGLLAFAVVRTGGYELAGVPQQLEGRMSHVG
jgi:polysaccharide chain length determinant protein (PEP-CTERM system associated)